MDSSRELYIMRFEENNYSPIIEIITKYNARIKRKSVNSNDIELIICCDSNFINQVKIKNVEITPYDLIIRQRANL